MIPNPLLDLFSLRNDRSVRSALLLFFVPIQWILPKLVIRDGTFVSSRPIWLNWGRRCTKRSWLFWKLLPYNLLSENSLIEIFVINFCFASIVHWSQKRTGLNRAQTLRNFVTAAKTEGRLSLETAVLVRDRVKNFDTSLYAKVVNSSTPSTLT